MIDKVKVARSFSRSANTYDTVAYFQRQVGEQLLSLMPQETPADTDLGGNSLCLDLGCGTGYFRSTLEQLYAVHNYVGVDIAEGMLHYFLKDKYLQQTEGCKQVEQTLLCADAEKLPLTENSVAVLYSNLALQWCDDLSQLFVELHRVLQPGGFIGLSTLGPLTLVELKRAWSQVDDLVHVNRFVDQECWCQAIEASGLVIEQYHYQLETLYYKAVQELLSELKLLGAHNVNEGQRQTLTGRQRIQGFLEAYQQFRQNEVYPATYEVFFWTLKKRKESQL